MHFFKNAQAQDYSVRSERLCIPFAIVHNAVPANKTSSSDLNDCLIISTEGIVQTYDPGANFTAENDANGIFGLLLKNMGSVRKLLKVEVIDPSSGSVAVSRKGASSSGVTASQNIAVSVDWSGNLATTDLSATLCVDFNVDKS